MGTAHQKEHGVTEAGTGVTWPQLRVAGSPGGLFPDPAEGCGPPAAWFWASGLQNRERIKACYTNLWVFVTAAPGGEYAISLLLLVATPEASVHVSRCRPPVHRDGHCHLVGGSQGARPPPSCATRATCQHQLVGPSSNGVKPPSRVHLFVTPWTVARQAPLSMGFSRRESWSGLPFPPPGDLPDPGTGPASLTAPALARGFFTTSATWGQQCALLFSPPFYRQGNRGPERCLIPELQLSHL